MIIAYGDYKDLNFVNPFCGDVEEIARLQPFWNIFLSPGLKLEERCPSENEMKDFAWIDIRHNVFENNEYTSYALLPPCRDETNAYCAKQKAKKKGVRAFVCAENKFWITELEDTRGQASPASFAELKQREIVWECVCASRVAEAEILGQQEDIGKIFVGVKNILKECVRTDAQIDSAAQMYAEKVMADIYKWKKKEFQRWFHPTNVSY